ncbi:hypothetical protein TEA_022072 [Camellia sinensis var. sinensis]|uniref:Uncharacterized protein n=1 Tax=Camellia sinensis var. sinensis TaxID=542762 RepID=A0A4S4E3F1_CAMSN|nr:hypothetical protein TEA_022072 [Camellia sinensis var. sinensis]
MHAAVLLSNTYLQKLVTNWYICRRKDGQDAKKELPKRNLRDELEERERRHFSSKDKSYIGRKVFENPFLQYISSFTIVVVVVVVGQGKGDVEDHLIPCSVDADDANVELKNDDGRLSLIANLLANLPELILMLTKSLYQWPDLLFELYDSSTCGVIVNYA